MNIGSIRNMRSAALAAGLGIGAMLLAWAVSAEDEVRGLAMTSRLAALAIPKMPAKTATANFEAIVARPLFLEPRRPAPPKPLAAAADQQQAATPPFAATLLGVIVSPSVKSAIVRLASGKSVTVAEGETVEGWQLKRVTPEAAQFQQRTATTELAFPARQAFAGPAPPATGLSALVHRRR
jgi:hypothetical protein